MNFEKQKQHYEALKGVQYLENDKELLAKKNPRSLVLKKRTQDLTRMQQDILWALLKVCSIDEIIANRKPNDAIPNLIAIEKEKKKQDAIKTLLVTNLERISYRGKVKLFNAFGLKSKSMKNKIIHPIIVAFKNKELEKATKKSQGIGSESNAPKGSDGITGKLEEVPAEMGKENELKEQVEELEDENSDLQDQLEEKNQENEELQERIAEFEQQNGSISDEQKDKIIEELLNENENKKSPDQANNRDTEKKKD